MGMIEVAFQVLGAAIVSLIGALFLQLAARIVVSVKPPYGQAFKATLLATIIVIAGEFAASTFLGWELTGANLQNILIYFGAAFLIQSFIVGRVIEDDDRYPVGFVRGAIISIIQTILGVIVGAILGAIAFFIFGLAPSRYLPANPAIPLPAASPAGAPAVSTEAEAQKEAVRRYPSLGVQGSDFNKAFLARHRQYKAEKPEFFNDPAWPIKLAEETAAAGYR
jgi:hypothetical protein